MSDILNPDCHRTELTYEHAGILTNSVELSRSWEATSRSATPEFPNILRNPRVHYCVQNSPPLGSILSQINPVQNTPSYFYKIHLNIILPSAYRSS
jgi:hypothetical protein